MMSNRGALLLMAISAMLIMALPASAQDDISIIFKRHLKDLQKLHKQKTEDEQKLDSMLFDLLRTAEAADTSHDEQVILNYYMQHFPRMGSVNLFV